MLKMHVLGEIAFLPPILNHLIQTNRTWLTGEHTLLICILLYNGLLFNENFCEIK